MLSPACTAYWLQGRSPRSRQSCIADTLDQVAQLPQVREVDLADAAALLVDQAGLLCPHDLQVVGRELVEHLTRTPSVDTSADADAVAREAEAAETAAQRAEQNRLTVKRLPDGSVSGRFRLCPVDAPILTGWLTRADTKHPGDDEFADDRDREQRRGDHLATTLRDALTATPEQRAAGAKSVQVKVVVTTSLEASSSASPVSPCSPRAAPSPPPSCAASLATPASSPPSSAATPQPSTSAAPAATSALRRSRSSRSATAVASHPVATDHQPSATPTTSGNGTSADPPTWPTGHSSAPSTTCRSIDKGGR